MLTEIGRPLEVVTIPDPEPQECEVVVSVARCGICGSDVHMAHDPALGAQPGDILGHEFSGEVVDVGRSVSRIAKGDHVTVIPFKGCGHCPNCVAGDLAWCLTRVLQGGGYADYVAVNERQCVALPGAASFDEGAIVEPLAVALHGVRMARLKPGDRVVILGAGPIGLSVAFWARRLGAVEVIVQDIAETQRERAFQLGATGFRTAGERHGTRDASRQPAPDIVFECAGVPGLIMEAVDLVKVRGQVVLMGLCTRPDPVVPFALVAKEVRLTSSAFFHPAEFAACLDLFAAGVVEPKLLITNTIDLADVPRIFAQLHEPNPHCKVLIGLRG